MNLLTIFQVLWKPREAFSRFIGGPSYKPLVFVGLLAVLFSVNAYARQIELVINKPLLLPLGFIQSFLGLIFTPTLYAILIFVIARLILRQNIGLKLLINLFLLCAMPIYIESIMTAVFGFTGIGLGSFVPYDLRLAKPFFFGMIATLTPFLAWVTFMWWIALKQLLNLPPRKHMLLIGSLVFSNMLLEGSWRVLVNKILL